MILSIQNTSNYSQISLELAIQPQGVLSCPKEREKKEERKKNATVQSRTIFHVFPTSW